MQRIFSYCDNRYFIPLLFFDNFAFNIPNENIILDNGFLRISDKI